MLDCFNNIWVILICIILFYFIIKKIYNMTQPFDEHRFMVQCRNQEKLKNKLNLNSIPNMIPNIASFYIGL
jgi:hypothetical protein